MRLCYVTAFWDIGRDNWVDFQRSFDKYFEVFTHMVKMFKNDPENKEYELFVFIDSKHYARVSAYVGDYPNIFVLAIDEDFMKNNIPLWSRLEKETTIMASEQYRTFMASRLQFPEHNNPKYTLINHAKIDFINFALLFSKSEAFCWIDFGFFQSLNKVPSRLLDVNLFDKNKIHFTLIHPLDERDKDVGYTLLNAPEKIDGGFFLGTRENVKKYQKLFHKIHSWFQEKNIADDDQHVALQCYFHVPSFFQLHYLGSWHKAFVQFQKMS